MNVWIDLGHIPQYNFYKQFILRLVDEGNFVYLTVLNRGKLPNIVKKELSSISNIQIDVVGNHRSNKISAIFEANILRFIKLLLWKTKYSIDIAFSNSYLVGLIAKLYFIRSYAFGDDLRTTDYKLKSIGNHKLFYCLYKLNDDLNFELNDKTFILKALKEWSYLAPSVYKSDFSVLDEYGVKPKEYVFLREVSVGTVNYTGQASGAILNVANLIPKDKKVLFSLEDKSKRDLYPKDWILLQEPLKDVHSLIYYAAGLVSSGDSMAREAALLGIPAYYLGIRHSMPANLAAAEVADFNNEITMPFSEWVNKLNLSTEELENNQQQTRTQVNEKFIDLNEYMYGLVKL